MKDEKKEDDVTKFNSSSTCKSNNHCNKYHDYNYIDDDDDDPMGKFLPLDIEIGNNNPSDDRWSISYDASVQYPEPAIELIKTQDIPNVRILLKRSFFGIPVPFPSRVKRATDSKSSGFNNFSERSLSHDSLGGGMDTSTDTAASTEGNQKNFVRKSGKKINRQSAQYALTAGMILGIRECVGGVEDAELRINNGIDNNSLPNPPSIARTRLTTADGNNDNHNHKNDETCKNNFGMDDNIYQAIQSYLSNKEALKSECSRTLKYEFPSSLLSQHQPLSHDDSDTIPQQPSYSYRFKAYAPRIFSHIRSIFGIDKQLFLHSICGKFNFLEFMSNAKSNSFFFFSHDGRYMIKTQTVAECKFMQQILPHYYRYIIRNKHSTFLPHFYGMYRVQITGGGASRHGAPVHFMIMKSVFGNTPLEIHKIWDIKGAKYHGRKAKENEFVFKDLDILEENHKIGVGSQKKNAIINQLKKDTAFLSSLGIMDYSLLLGVHDTLQQVTEDIVNDCDSTKSYKDDRIPETFINIATNKNETTPNIPISVEINNEDAEYPNRTNTPLRRYHKNLKQQEQLQGERVMDHPIPFPSIEKMQHIDYEHNEHKSIDDFADNAKPYFEFNSNIKNDDDNTSNHSTDASSAGENVISYASSFCWDDILPGMGTTETPQQQLQQEEFDTQYNHSLYSTREDLGIETDARTILKSSSLTKSKKIYFCGIIDILQHYNTRKWGETVMKKAIASASASSAGGIDLLRASSASSLGGGSGSGSNTSNPDYSSELDISCVDPETYANRFIRFVSDLIE